MRELAEKQGARTLPPDSDPIHFFRLEYPGRVFLACADALLPFRPPFPCIDDFVDHPLWWHHWLSHFSERSAFARRFVIEEKAGERFLNILSAVISAEDRHLPESLDLPSSEFVGLSTEGEGSIAHGDGVPYDYALFRDGLALLAGPPSHRDAAHRIGHQKHGLE